MKILYESMEMLTPELSEPARMANIRGGLGILAGETMEGLAKAGIEAVAVVPSYHQSWLTRETVSYENLLEPVCELRPRLGGKRHSVKVGKIVRGGTSVYLLECPDVFDVLYTQDKECRLLQEVLIAKVTPLLLKKIEFKPDIVWLQEGHTAITIPETRKDPYFSGTRVLFTTHTPAPEGMEKFYGDWFGKLEIDGAEYGDKFVKDGMIDLTKAAMILSDAVNAVSQEHCEVTKRMFPKFQHKIVGITNGYSRELWLSPNLKRLGENPNPLQLWMAHLEDKRMLIEDIKRRTGIQFNSQKPLLGWMRRIAFYKNQHPMLEPIIRAICSERGQWVDTYFGRVEGLGFQVFSAGRAAESDTRCLGWIEDFHRWMQYPQLQGKFVFLPDYNYELLKITSPGSDVWLNVPWPEWEACGGSDKRAASNGNINLTTRTGGAMEYIIEDKNGYFVEPYEAKTIYEKLKIISELYYAWTEKGDARWLEKRMNAFQSGKALDISFMIEKYIKVFERLLKGE